MYWPKQTLFFKTTVWLVIFVFISAYTVPPSFANVLARSNPPVVQSNAPEQVESETENEAPKFAKGRFIVKYKSQEAAQEINAPRLARSSSASESNLKKLRN